MRALQLVLLLIAASILSLSCSFAPIYGGACDNNTRCAKTATDWLVVDLLHRHRHRQPHEYKRCCVRARRCCRRRHHHHPLYAMKVTIRMVGKKKTGGEKWLDQACSMYQTRLKPAGIDVQTEFHKSDHALIKGVHGDYDKDNTVVLLDPKGKRYTSEKLAEDIYRWIERGGSRLVFVIGGAEGLPEELRSGSVLSRGGQPIMVSLSDLTFTHQFARLVLIEQLYRASEIRKGSGYHK